MFNIHWVETTTEEEEVVGAKGKVPAGEVMLEASNEVGDGVGIGSAGEGDVEMGGKVSGEVRKGDQRRWV